MSKYLVCVSDQRHASYDVERTILSQIDAELRLCSCETAADIAKQCADADAVLLDLAPMTAEAIAGLKRCKVINRYGVGYENVDLDAATSAGIQVTYVPDYCMEDVSDHALALMLSCLRHIPMRDRRVREGAWNLQGASFRLAGKTLGVIGAGRIARASSGEAAEEHIYDHLTLKGRQNAVFCRPFGLEILNIWLTVGYARSYGARSPTSVILRRVAA